MACGIYCIRNFKNSKSYVGRSVNIAARWYVHRRSLTAGKHHSILLQRSWNKHGTDAFEFKVLEECLRDDLVKREQYWIDNLMAATPELGLNIFSSASGSNLGRKLTPEHRAKIAKSMTGTKRESPYPESARRERSERQKGKPIPWMNGDKSPEHREKLRAAATGQKQSAETREKRRASWKARFGDKAPEYLFRASRASAAKRSAKRAARLAVQPTVIAAAVM